MGGAVREGEASQAAEAQAAGEEAETGGKVRRGFQVRGFSCVAYFRIIWQENGRVSIFALGFLSPGLVFPAHFPLVRRFLVLASLITRFSRALHRFYVFSRLLRIFPSFPRVACFPAPTIGAMYSRACHRFSALLTGYQRCFVLNTSVAALVLVLPLPSRIPL